MVKCPSCSAPIVDSEIEAERNAALCADCGAEVRLDRDGDGWLALGYTPPPPPDGLVVEIDEPSADEAGYRSSAKRVWNAYGSGGTPHVGGVAITA